MTPEEVAQGVYRLGTRWANFHLVLDGGEAIVVDAGYPRYYRQLEHGLSVLGQSLTPVSAVLVTHHHVDHAGTAEAVRAHLGATVLVHAHDAGRVRGDEPSHPPQGFYGSAWRLTMLRYLAHTVAAGGAGYRPVSSLELIEEEGPLDLPGQPRVIYTPGHTAGHYSVLLPERGVLFTGDALVNHDYASGRRGIALHRFNEDRGQAVASLERIESVSADTLLFGHGDPWRGDARAAVATARERAAGV